MEDFNLYRNLENELVSDQSKNAIIQKVFENRTKSMLQGKITDFFPDGGGVGAKKIYTPYEFLYELLPEVYGRNYVVSDAEGIFDRIGRRGCRGALNPRGERHVESRNRGLAGNGGLGARAAHARGTRVNA